MRAKLSIGFIPNKQDITSTKATIVSKNLQISRTIDFNQITSSTIDVIRHFSRSHICHFRAFIACFVMYRRQKTKTLT
jgi:hypothetical protein